MKVEHISGGEVEVKVIRRRSNTMTNPEQTLRERLADVMRAIYGRHVEDSSLDAAAANNAISIIRDWLESEAPEVLRKSASEWSTNVAPGKLPYWKHLSRALAQSL